MLVVFDDNSQIHELLNEDKVLIQVKNQNYDIFLIIVAVSVT